MGKSFLETLKFRNRFIVSPSRPADFQPQYLRCRVGGGSRFYRSDFNTGDFEKENRFDEFRGSGRSQGQGRSLERRSLGGVQCERGENCGAVGGEACR